MIRALTDADLDAAADLLAERDARQREAEPTDWRMTNLLASRFWPKRGFRPTFLRLHRHVA